MFIKHYLAYFGFFFDDSIKRVLKALKSVEFRALISDNLEVTGGEARGGSDERAHSPHLCSRLKLIVIDCDIEI